MRCGCRFVLTDTAKTFELTLSFVSSMLADDYQRLSRPVYRVVLELKPLTSIASVLIFNI